MVRVALQQPCHVVGVIRRHYLLERLLDLKVRVAELIVEGPHAATCARDATGLPPSFHVAAALTLRRTQSAHCAPALAIMTKLSAHASVVGAVGFMAMHNPPAAFVGGVPYAGSWETSTDRFARNRAAADGLCPLLKVYQHVCPAECQSSPRRATM